MGCGTHKNNQRNVGACSIVATVDAANPLEGVGFQPKMGLPHPPSRDGHKINAPPHASNFFCHGFNVTPPRLLLFIGVALWVPATAGDYDVATGLGERLSDPAADAAHTTRTGDQSH